MKYIPYAKQSIDEQDVQAVVNALKSDWLTQGPSIKEFEQALAQKVQAQYGVAVNSATSGLHLACLALGVGKDTIVWTSPISFVASSNCALYCGAKIDFVDICPKTYNISVEALHEKCQWAKENNVLPKVLVAVHFAGQSCDMKEIAKLAKQYDFKVIEDAAHAIGGCYDSHPIGCGKYSDCTVFSLHPVKIMTTGEGGVVVTNDAQIYEKVLSLRSHGITREPDKYVSEDQGAWYYQQLELGFNYRMSELQAALGLSQLQRLDDFVAKRHEIASYYDEALKDQNLVLPFQAQYSHSAYHLYPIQVPNSRKAVFDCLRAKQIGVNVHYIPIHTQPFYQKLGFKAGDFMEAEKYYAHAISLPMYYDLSQASQNYVIESLKVALAELCQAP